MAFYDRVWMSIASTGTGSLALGAAVDGYRSFAAASVPDGATVSYTIVDGSNWETGHGTYSASGTSLSRTPIATSASSGPNPPAISIAPGASVFLDVLAADLTDLATLAGAAFRGGLSAPSIGIGTTTPTGLMEICDPSTAVLTLTGSTATTGSVGLDMKRISGTVNASIRSESEIANDYAHIRFLTRGPDGLLERVHIDSGGYVGIGTATPQAKLDVNGAAIFRSTMSVTGTTSFGNDGIQVGSGASGGLYSDSNKSLALRSLNSPSAAIYIQNYNGTNSYAVFSTGSIYFYLPLMVNANCAPNLDNSFDLGISGSNRWRNLYIVNNPTVGSDARIKGPPKDFDDAFLDVWADVRWRLFQRIKALNEEGPEKARWHSGVIAQELVTVFSNRGLDATRYGLLCHDAWDAQEEISEPAITGVPSKTGEDGTVLAWKVEPQPARTTQAARDAGDIYSIRYEQALVAEAAWSRREHGRSQATVQDLLKRVVALEQQHG